ncbi:MAG TPA: hypothetical protein VM846_03565 [Vicinamibacterales bacterium]|nr:hypothetical protein [Vicinamibacterales bacterium]
MRTSLAATLILTTMLAQPAAAQSAQDDERLNRAREMAAEIARLARGFERTQRFRVVLIVSSTIAEPPVENIPAEARKALEDMKGFLPFKSYRLFGTAEMQLNARGDAKSVRITGGDNQTFLISIVQDAVPLSSNSPRPIADARLSLTFILRDVSELSPSVPTGRTLFEGPSINTLVTMDVGETIVVGTSRVKGSRGMLALLTALPNPAK